MHKPLQPHVQVALKAALNMVSNRLLRVAFHMTYLKCCRQELLSAALLGASALCAPVATAQVCVAPGLAGPVTVAAANTVVNTY